MYLAAECRYREGRFLLEQGKLDAGIYLLGYVAEMTLKLAYCRLDPTLSFQQLVMSRLSVAESRWRAIYGRGAGTRLDLHNPVALLIILEDGRSLFGLSSLTAEETRLINSYVFTIHDNWMVGMRYRGHHATVQEADAVLVAVEWLRDNYQLLWK